jgi:hypothetical protein
MRCGSTKGKTVNGVARELGLVLCDARKWAHSSFDHTGQYGRRTHNVLVTAIRTQASNLQQPRFITCPADPLESVRESIGSEPTGYRD